MPHCSLQVLLSPFANLAGLSLPESWRLFHTPLCTAPLMLMTAAWCDMTT
ncbi:hypothetical protein A2U01_0110935, partial [Trifolium medium]|nr:hypothetical protein [Trifolium medium]